MAELYRLYEVAGKDGYCPEWHETIKHAVRAEAGNRCVRCKHPYQNGQHGRGEWTPCDELCTHWGPLRINGVVFQEMNPTASELVSSRPDHVIEAAWRILTVHHLDGNKLNCRWWNLAALCQRCHLQVQGRVKMHRPYFLEHSEWFKPYVAGFYAFTIGGEDLTREQTMARLDELLLLGRQFPRPAQEPAT